MKDKLSVGMYVRTNEGIRKIIEDYDEGYELDKNLHYLYPEGHDLYKDDLEELDIKASHNIIDLIEVGDYVNGYPVYETIEYPDNTRAIVIADDNKSIIWEESSQYIKSIVTKEMFESMKYEVK